MQRPYIPPSILKDLRCGHCRKFVTCGPVYMTPDGHMLCGRCLRVAKRDLYRNLAFEAVASLYLYPCHYWPQHCNKPLAWNDALRHELDCSYQSVCNVCCCQPSLMCKSDRKFSIGPDNQISMLHVSDELLDILKCVSCECYLSNGPVFLVVDGKSVCHRCVHSNGAPKGAVRNLAYETIAPTLVFPCIYRHRGCTFRSRFGREIWRHEHECTHGQQYQQQHHPFPQLYKKSSKAGDRTDSNESKGKHKGLIETHRSIIQHQELHQQHHQPPQLYEKSSKAGDRTDSNESKGKPKGLIETHNGIIYATITPNTALFGPNAKGEDVDKVKQELTQVITKKHPEEDVQSMDSVMSKATFESVESGARSLDHLSPPPRGPSRDSFRKEINAYYRQPAWSRPSLAMMAKSGHVSPEIQPSPTPMGYNRVAYNGYFQESPDVYGRPPSNEFNPYLHHFSSINYGPGYQQHALKKESFRMGNKDLIEELKVRQNLKPHREVNPYGRCSNLQDIVHIHEQVFDGDKYRVKQ